MLHLVIALDTLTASASIRDIDPPIFSYTREARLAVAETIRKILLNVKIDPVPIEDIDIIETSDAG